MLEAGQPRRTRRDWATASSPGSIVRLFSATTTASHAGTVRSVGDAEQQHRAQPRAAEGRGDVGAPV